MAYTSQSLVDPGGTGDYTNLLLWEAGEEEDLEANDVLAKVHCFSSDGSLDFATEKIYIAGWGNTNAENHIEILCTGSDRHNGQFDDSKYRLKAFNLWHGILHIEQGHTVVQGLQLMPENYDGNFFTAISIFSPFCKFSYNIARCFATGSGGGEIQGFLCDTSGNSGAAEFYNNVIYWASGSQRIKMGIRVTASGSYFPIVYNNTIVVSKENVNEGSDYGIRGVLVGNLSANAGHVLLKNNISINDIDVSKNCFGIIPNVTWHPSSSNNISNDLTAPGFDSFITSSVKFAASESENFNLDSTDIIAMDNGVDLSADSFVSFSDDIAGTSRPYGSAWDIGAFEWFEIPRSILEASIYNSGRLNTLKATFFVQNLNGKKVTI